MILICKLEGKYFLWSTEGDGPCGPPWTLDELKTWYRAEFGENGMRELPARLQRVEASGTSALGHDRTFESLIVVNRAWRKEKPATLEQFKAWARGEGPIYYLNHEVEP